MNWRARIVGIAVVVEVIGQSETPHDDGVARHGTVAGKLVFIAVDVFPGVAKAEIVRE